jgi:predicted lipoprotein
MLPPRAALAFALLCLSAVSAHAEADHAAIARASLDQYIRPGYAQLAESAALLSQSVGALCTQPSAASLKGAQTAFAAMVATWGKVEPIRFGPVAEEHRYERIFYWPDPKGLGGRQVHEALAKQDQGVTETGALKGKSVALQGLPALEELLYGDGAEALAKGTGAAAFRCHFAASIAANVAATASAPKGGLITYWDVSARRFLGASELNDGCGIAPTRHKARFLLTSGQGWLVEADALRAVDQERRSSPYEWDNHAILVS